MQELNQLIGIKLLTLSFIKIFGSLAHFPGGGGNSRFAHPPLRTPMNTTLTVRLQHFQQDWARLVEMTESERVK